MSHVVVLVCPSGATVEDRLAEKGSKRREVVTEAYAIWIPLYGMLSRIAVVHAMDAFKSCCCSLSRLLGAPVASINDSNTHTGFQFRN